MPEARLAVGVKVAVRVFVPVTVRRLRLPVPRVAVTSMRSNPTGASENVKVMLAVWPSRSAVVDDEMVTVGAEVSMLMSGVSPASPPLLAASM